MMYQATWSNAVIAEADEADVIHIEGNVYFPPTAVKSEFLQPSEHHTTCHWKGEASYHHVKVGDEMNENAAWYYPTPQEGSVEKVGKDFAGYVAFWHGVEVELVG